MTNGPDFLDSPDDLASPSADDHYGEAPDDDAARTEQAEAEKPEPAEKASSSRRKRVATPDLTRAQVKRIVSKATEIHETDTTIRKLLAAALGTDNDVSSLTAAIIIDGRALTVFDDLTELASADPMDAVVQAASLDRDRLRALHRVLQHVGATDTATLNPADVKAGMTVAKAAQGLNDDQSFSLMLAAGLLN